MRMINGAKAYHAIDQSNLRRGYETRYKYIYRIMEKGCVGSDKGNSQIQRQKDGSVDSLPLTPPEAKVWSRLDEKVWHNDIVEGSVKSKTVMRRI